MSPHETVRCSSNDDLRLTAVRTKVRTRSGKCELKILPEENSSATVERSVLLEKSAVPWKLMFLDGS